MPASIAATCPVWLCRPTITSFGDRVRTASPFQELLHYLGTAIRNGLRCSCVLMRTISQDRRMTSSLMPVGVPQLPGARPAMSNICDCMPLASLVGDILNQSESLSDSVLIMRRICDRQVRRFPVTLMVYEAKAALHDGCCRDESALRMCPRRRTYRSRIITTEPFPRASATTCGRCRLAARYGCTTKKGPPTSTWRDGGSTLDTRV